MRGPLNRSLLVATAVALVAMAALAAAACLALSRADGLLDRLARSQTQLALANRIEADATGLMVDEPAIRSSAAAMLVRDLETYHRSIDEETAVLAAGDRAEQEQERDRAQVLRRLAGGLVGRNVVSQRELSRFRAVIQTIARREEAESARSLARMRRLRAEAILCAIGLPLLLCVPALWFLAALRRGIGVPLAALGVAAERIGRGDASPAVKGFSDFAPLARAVVRADAEISRQRAALEQANRSLEREVAERTAVLARQNARLAEIDRTRRLFFSQVGHELRTPVTVIRGEAEVALRDIAASPQSLRDTLDQIVATGAFLGRRIDDLLAVARSEDGRLTIERRPLDLAATAREVQRTAGAYAASMGASVALAIESEPIAIEGDASWMQQALLALVDNAIKHGGGGRITITAGLGGGEAFASVADDGPGVPVDILPRLFDAWHGPGAFTRGAGLGLAVARWVAEAHGGAIAAENGASGGLRVTLRLPAA